MRRLALLMLCVGLAACATTARMHSQAELSAVERRCGLAVGELFQDESEKRLLFFVRVAPSPAERACVARWARENHLRPVFIEAADFPAS